MGSYLMRCGVTGRTLQEKDRVCLVFLNREIMGSDGALASVDNECRSPFEGLIISGTQGDSGNVTLDADSIAKAVTLMTRFYEHEHPTHSQGEWKAYIQEKIGSIDDLSSSSQTKINKRFNYFLNLLRSGRPYFDHPVQHSVVSLQVSYVDEAVFKEVEKSPELLYSPFLSAEKHGRIDGWVKDFNEYLQFIALFSYQNAQQMTQQKENRGFFTGSQAERRRAQYTPTAEFLEMTRRGTRYWNSPSYFRLVYDWFGEESENAEQEPLDKAIADFIHKNRDLLLLEYAQRLGVQFSVSDFAPQDYSDKLGRGFRHLMHQVSVPQKKKALAYQWEGTTESVGQREYIQNHLQKPEWTYDANSPAFFELPEDLKGFHASLKNL